MEHGHPGLPASNSLYGPSGRKATFEEEEGFVISFRLVFV